MGGKKKKVSEGRTKKETKVGEGEEGEENISKEER